ncbi:MAG: hypothetical protein IKT55_00260 [Clostridia bacterium]|nr:hypothetical protein [Clostridia bacterium]
MDKNEKAKFDINELIKKARSGKTTDASKEQVDDFINNNLSENQAKQVRDLLSDPEKTKAVLNSDAAKMIFKKFFGGKSDG